MKWPVPVIWTSKTKYVDCDTGEQITKHKAETEYTIFKTTQHATFTNVSRTRAVMEYTKLCKHRQQLEFNFDRKRENT